MHGLGDINFYKASPGRPAAHAQICPLFKKKLPSALRAPLVIKWKHSMNKNDSQYNKIRCNIKYIVVR